MNVVSNTRVDIVARGVIKGCIEAGKEPTDVIAIFRIPGAWEGEGFKILAEVRRRLLRPHRLDVRGGGPRRREAEVGGADVRSSSTRTPRFIVQGITGREAVNLTRECLDYGSKIVGGVTPGRAGRDIYGVPVYDCVRDVVAKHGPVHGSVVSVPPGFTRDAVVRGDRERHPADRDRHREHPAPGGRADGRARGAARRAHHRPELPRPDHAGRVQDGRHRRPGGEHAAGLQRGPIGIMSRSGGMTTEIASTLTAAGLGQSTAVSIGGDAIIGSTYAELMPLFEADPETKAIAIYSEPGGRMEAELAEWVREHQSRLPIVAFMAGRFMDEMKGMRFGHAGTIVEGKEDTTAEKIARMEAAGHRGGGAHRGDPGADPQEAREKPDGGPVHRREGRRRGRARRRRS